MDELDRVEAINLLRNMAEMGRALYLEFKEQGFTDVEALKLTQSWLIGTCGGSQA